MVEISRYVQTRNLFSGDRKESALRCKNSFIPEFRILQDMLKKKKKRHLWYSKWFIIAVRFNIFLNVFFWHSSKLATSNPLNSYHVHVAVFKLFCIYMYTLKLFHCFNGSWLGKKTWKLSWVVDVKGQLNTPLKILQCKQRRGLFLFISAGRAFSKWDRLDWSWQSSDRVMLPTVCSWKLILGPRRFKKWFCWLSVALLRNDKKQHYCFVAVCSYEFFGESGSCKKGALGYVQLPAYPLLL